jgi:porin
MLGGDTTMPPFSDSIVDVDSDFRRGLASKGVALRVIAGAQYTQNTLRAPVPMDDQVYVGESPYGNASITPVFTADLRQFHLHKAQVYISAVWNWVTWNPAGPKTLQLSNFYFYKEFGEQRVQLKAGYSNNDVEFVGIYVGGSLATSAQGVYAVLPYEVGMSYWPLTSPTFNVRIKGPKDTYLKFALQRSLDAAGGPATVAGDHAGFRFIPRGDKLLDINEVGLKQESRSNTPEIWFRAGYMRNSTVYQNLVTDQNQAGNYVAYPLMDYQLRKPDSGNPTHGLYVGGSVISASSHFNAYDRYYEARLYQEGTFRHRPYDVASLVASHTGYSKDATDSLIAQGQTVWSGSTTLTGSYSLHISPGNYLSLGLSYVHGPAITPRVPDALNFGTIWTAFF